MTLALTSLLFFAGLCVSAQILRQLVWVRARFDMIDLWISIVISAASGLGFCLGKWIYG